MIYGGSKWTESKYSSGELNIKQTGQRKTSGFKQPMKPGVYTDLPIQAYHAGEGYSSSQLKFLRKHSPYHFRHEFLTKHPLKPDPTKWGNTKRNMCIGGAVAAMMDSEEVFKAGYYVLDDKAIYKEAKSNSKNTNLFKNAFAAAVKAYSNATVIVTQEYEQAKAIAEAVHNHPDPWMREQLANFFSEKDLIAEVSYYWQDEETGLLIKTRPDLSQRRHLLADIKTTTDCGKWAFSKRIHENGHHVQAAMGIDIANKADKCMVQNWLLIVVEQSPPHDVACYHLGEKSLNRGRQIYRDALRTLKACLDQDVWLGKQSGLEEIDIPPYALNEG